MNNRSAESFGRALYSASAFSCVLASYWLIAGQMTLTTTSELPGSQAVSDSIIGRASNAVHRILCLHCFGVDLARGLGCAGFTKRVVGLIGLPAIKREFGESTEH